MSPLSPDVQHVTCPPATYDPAPFQQARDDVRDLVSGPLARWMQTPPAYRRETAYQSLLTVPLDLAAAGYIVTVSQDDDGWRLDVRRDMQPGCTLRLYGVARSYVAMLYRFADLAIIRIDDSEHRAKRAAQEGQAA